jgi:hypothetical protein
MGWDFTGHGRTCTDGRVAVCVDLQLITRPRWTNRLPKCPNALGVEVHFAPSSTFTIWEFLMRHGFTVLALGLALASGWAQAADPAPAEKTPQQNKMATCNKEADGKKGDERKAFMKECLSAKKETQQSKMKTCNAEATGKKGDERKAFMSECLKK